MKIFIVGMPYSGRTTVAKALCQDEGFQYIDASSWIKTTFRDQKEGEHIQQYLDEYHTYLTRRTQANPFFAIDNVWDSIEAYKDKSNVFVIDGVLSPKDFVHLFDVNEDTVIFLNRTDNTEEFKDSESIAVSVMRDYCFWMSAAGLLPKDRWLEYNFKIPGDDSDFIKKLGSKNSVFLARSIVKAIAHLKESLKELLTPPQDPQS
jgi:adenylate kinase family enzyme